PPQFAPSHRPVSPEHIVERPLPHDLNIEPSPPQPDDAEQVREQLVTRRRTEEARAHAVVACWWVGVRPATNEFVVRSCSKDELRRDGCFVAAERGEAGEVSIGGMDD